MTRPSIDAPEGSLGAHGYVSTDPDLQALFIASGRGIKPGTTLDTVNNVDVAPTAAKLLGLEMRNVDGRVLTEILDLSRRPPLGVPGLAADGFPPSRLSVLIS